MNIRSLSWRYAFRFGTISALVYIIASLIIYFLGHNPAGRHSWLIYWLPIVFIVLSVRAFRLRLGGYISFPDAFINGFGVGIVATFFISLYMFILLKSDPTLITDYIDQNLKILDKNKEDVIRVQGKEVYNRLVASNKALDVRNIFSDGVIRKLAGQVITSLFVAAFFRKKQNTTP
jgi:hypothetical protein